MTSDHRSAEATSDAPRVRSANDALDTWHARLGDAARAAASLREAGPTNERIIYLPMRGDDTPSSNDVAALAGSPFQSMTCLGGCAKSPRFASIDADRRVAWCSYTRSRRSLETPTFAALETALADLDLTPCDGEGLVRLALQRRAGTRALADGAATT